MSGMPHRSARLVLLVGITMVGLLSASGCGSSVNRGAGSSDTDTSPAATAGPTLEGPTWTLDTRSLGAPATGVTITLQFADGKAQGTSGCNTYSGSYTVSGSSLSIGPDLATTMMACPEPAMTAEAAYVIKLLATATYRIAGDELTLLDGFGDRLLRFNQTG